MHNGCQPAVPLGPAPLHQASLFEINGSPHDVPCALEGRCKPDDVVSGRSLGTCRLSILDPR